MAHIIQAPNQNKEEIEAYINQYVHKKQLEHEQSKSKRSIAAVIWLLILALCVIAIGALLFKAGLMANIRESVKMTLDRWHNVLWVACAEGKSIFHLVARLVCRLLALIVLLLYFLAPLLVPVLLIGILAAIALFALGAFWSNFSGFDLQEARDEARSKMDDELKRMQAGVDGEERALRAISPLSDECYIFANLDIYYNGGHNETDLIVVSPTGLTVVEVKNYSGELLGDLSDKELIQRKYQSKDEYTEKLESNPVRQIAVPINRLTHYLKDLGISVNIRRCALFVNEKVELHMTDREGLSRTCPLFLLQSPEMLKYLHTDGDHALDSATILRIVDALQKQIQRGQ